MRWEWLVLSIHFEQPSEHFLQYFPLTESAYICGSHFNFTHFVLLLLFSYNLTKLCIEHLVQLSLVGPLQLSHSLLQFEQEPYSFKNYPLEHSKHFGLVVMYWEEHLAQPDNSS